MRKNVSVAEHHRAAPSIRYGCSEVLETAVGIGTINCGCRSPAVLHGPAKPYSTLEVSSFPVPHGNHRLIYYAGVEFSIQFCASKDPPSRTHAPVIFHVRTVL